MKPTLIESMKDALKNDLERLKGRAYRRAEWAEGTLQRFHSAASNLKDVDEPRLRILYHWMFVPPTLWPFNIQDVLEGCLTTLEKGRHLTRRQRLLIDLLPEAPDEAVCTTVAEHELAVQRGGYEDLVKSQAKFAQNELALTSNLDLQRQWSRIKAAFDVAKYRDHKGLIRRTMNTERNLRLRFSVNSRRQEDVFRAAFDAFCLRWNLYGMQDDEPLLLKLAINLTPSGTMILIPAYWSFDPKRDIRWSAIASLHRARVPGRQGSALAEGVAERMKRAQKLRQLDAEALRRGLKGTKKHEFLCRGLGLVPETSPKRLARLRTEFGPRGSAVDKK